jgi:SH3 domain protein
MNSQNRKDFDLNLHRPLTSPGLSRKIGTTILLAFIGAALCGPVMAATAYISDTLTVPLRSGPSNANRILHRGLPSGTELTILARDDDSGFVQIRTSRGTEGWLPAQYLVDEPIARDRLVAANRQLREMTETLDQQKRQLAQLDTSKSQADQNNSQLQRKSAALTQELAEIRRVSAGAIAQNEANQELMALNDRLRSEVDELVAGIAVMEDNVQERWLMIGGALMLTGLVLGVSIKARPRRSAWN